MEVGGGGRDDDDDEGDDEAQGRSHKSESKYLLFFRRICSRPKTSLLLDHRHISNIALSIASWVWVGLAGSTKRNNGPVYIPLA